MVNGDVNHLLIYDSLVVHLQSESMILSVPRRLCFSRHDPEPDFLLLEFVINGDRRLSGVAVQCVVINGPVLGDGVAQLFQILEVKVGISAVLEPGKDEGEVHAFKWDHLSILGPFHHHLGCFSIDVEAQIVVHVAAI